MSTLLNSKVRKNRMSPKCLVPPLYMVPLHVLPPVVLDEIPDALRGPDWPVGRSGVSTPASSEESAVRAGESSRAAQQMKAAEPRLSASGWLGIIWVLGAGGCAAVNLLRALRGHHWLRWSRKALPSNMLSDTVDMLTAYGLTRPPRIWIVEGVGQPFVWGLLRGSIYVPPGFLSIESPEQRRDVLAHELSHIVRFDAVVNSLQVIAQAIFWFHPLVWWANRRIRVEREKCCDETAIARLHTSAKEYCSAVVETLANMKKSSRPVPSLAIAGPIRNIEERIRTMLRPGREFYKRPSLMTAAVVLLVAVLTVPGTLVLSATGETREAPTATEEAAMPPADKETQQGPVTTAGGAAATAHLGDLLRTFADPNLNGKSWFGYSVAVLGDNVLVGAPTNRAVYLFEGSTGKLLRTFVTPEAALGRLFGWYVVAVGKNALIADPGYGVETDGTVVNVKPSGRVYLFNGQTGELLHTFANPKPETYMAFGQGMAGMGDNRVVIEAVSQDRTASTAFLLDASTGKTLQVFDKPKRDTLVNPMYAYVAVAGEDVFVNAPEDNTGAEGAGCVYMFESATGKLVRTFLNPTPTAGDNFGSVIAASGNSVLIGASYATIGGKRTGAVYLFDRRTGKLLHTFLNPTPGETGTTGQGDIFGRSVAFVDDKVLIGVSLDDTGAENAGAAYLFDGKTDKVLHKFVNPHPVADARFGVQVAALGNNILIAAYYYSATCS